MKKHHSFFLIATIFVLALMSVLVIGKVEAGPLFAGGGAPTVVSYQGMVKDGGAPYTGAGYFKFAVVDAAGTTSYWSNDGTSSGGLEPAEGVQLTVADGLFHVMLGDTNLTNMVELTAGVFEGTERYLRVWFSSDGSTYTQLTPDRRIAAVPYALQAQHAVTADDADTLDGQDGSYYHQWGNLTGVPGDIADGDDDTQLPSGAIVLSDSGSDNTLINAGFQWTGRTISESWSIKTDMPTGRYFHAAAVADGKIFVMGGCLSTSGSRTVNEVYDPILDTWTTKASMPTGRAMFVAVEEDGIIYTIGGQTTLISDQASNEAYDPNTNSWSSKASMPTGRYNMAAAAVGGLIYVIGGESMVGPETFNEAYDPVADSWTTKASMPTGRHRLKAAVVDGVIYCFSGDQASTSQLNEAYDPASDSWTTKASMPTSRRGMAAASVNGVIYVIGGNISQGSNTSTLNEVYEPESDTWHMVDPMPTGRRDLSAAVVDGVIYVLGGTSSTSEYETANEAYNPPLYVYQKE